MKKFIAIPLLVLYLVAVSGMMVQLHFCGSKLSSWNVNQPKASCCCEEGGKQDKQTSGKLSAKADDCCSDKTITLKITQDQNKGDDILSQVAALQIAAVLPFRIDPVFSVPVATQTGEAYRANAPPGLWQNIPLYKLHARFTYYG